MTDPTGKVFISYRRNRSTETDALLRALHDRGIPTWRDVDSLVNEPTEAAIRAALNDDQTSGAVLWLTPDVITSPIIKDVEVPLAVRRRNRGDGFWLVIVLAGGLDYGDVDEIFAESLGGEDLSSWNLTKTSEEWATSADIRSLASAVLEQRLTSLRAARPEGPRVVSVHAKGTFPPGTEDDLALDWTEHFRAGAHTDEAWTAMSAAARDVSQTIKRHTGHSVPIRYQGTASMAAAFLLGSTYSTRDGRAPAWMQRQPEGTSFTPWRLGDSVDAAHARAAGWAADRIFKTAGATDLAVCISVNDDVAEAFARSRDISPPWRAILRIGSTRDRDVWTEPVAPVEAASLARLIIDEVRAFRREVGGITGIHLFMGAPAGLAFLLGTVIATLPPITTYEFDTVTGRYTRAVRVES